MSFSSSKDVVGVPDFHTVDIDAIEVAKALQNFVARGSKLTGVSLDEISTGVISVPKPTEQITLTLLLEKGMKLFDAIVWLTAGRPKSHPLSADSSITEESIPGLHEVAKAVFYVYFFLVTQARYPASSRNKDPPKTPNFLRVVMGLDKPQSYYIDLLCSFNATQFDARWAKNIQFKGLGQEALSRFGLGVAGYRLFGPFKLYEPKSDCPPDLLSAIEFAKSVSTAPPTWDIHPLTRDPKVLTARGNLNKNLSNLILEVFTEDQIKEMVESKILFKYPVKEPAYRNYLRWEAEDDISGGAEIFS